MRVPCDRKCFLSTICVLQLITVIEWQVFQFLGALLAPLIANFLHMIFVTIGLVGTCRYHTKTLIAYTVWSLIWIGWNAFIICIYLEAGVLRRTPNLILDLGGMEGKSWWRDHGIGCRTTIQSSAHSVASVQSSTTHSSQITSGNASHVDNCLVQYYYIEVIHSGLQCLLAILGFFVACFVVHAIREEEDASFWESQPVHDELEYIKMRYRSPARQSFRGSVGSAGLKTYDNLPGQLSDPVTPSGKESTLDASSYRYQPIGARPSAPPGVDTETLPILTSLPPQQTVIEDEGQLTIDGRVNQK